MKEQQAKSLLKAYNYSFPHVLKLIDIKDNELVLSRGQLKIVKKARKSRKKVNWGKKQSKKKKKSVKKDKNF